MKRASYTGSFWPAPEQELFLDAALFEDDRGTRAWEEVRAELVLDDIDRERIAILPLLYLTLRRRGVDDPLMARLKGLHREAWYHHRLLFHAFGPACRGLEARGIETMVLKGAAMVGLWNGQIARRMDDIDLLVRPKTALAAMETLDHLGWRQLGAAGFRQQLVDAKHGARFDSAGGLHLDLHWAVLNRRPGYGDVGSYDPWPRARPVQVQGTPTLALDPADLLVEVIAHGARWRSAAQLRWIADAVTVLRLTDGLSWDQVLRTASELGRVPVMREALRYLAERFSAPVPAAALAAFEAAPTSARQERAFRYFSEARTTRPARGRLRSRLGRVLRGVRRRIPV